MANATVVQTLLIQGLVLLAFGFSLSSGQTTSKNVLCYYSYGSSDYRGVTFYNISDIDTSVCTHLVYHSTWFDGLHIQTVDHIEAWEQFKALKLSKPSLKTILSVGGLHNDIETQAFDYRLARIYYANMLLRSWDFDGIDLVWSRNITPAVVNFIEEMHQMFLNGAEVNQRAPLILMFSVPERIGVVSEEVDLHKLGQAVDILQVLTIGYTWPWDKTTGLSTPLYGDGSTYGNVSGSIFNYLDGGMPPEKVHIAIQLYATTFTLSNPELTGVGAPSSSIGYPGEYPVGFGKLTYYEVCKRLQEEGYTAEFDPEGLVNFAYKGDQWMTYEDPASLEIKMEYIYEHKLGGVVVRFLHQDDYTGRFCNQGPYPLVSTIYRLASEDKTELSPQGQTPPKNVICHLNYWSINSIEPGVTGVTNYTISDIDTSHCTHVVYFFTPIDIGKLTLYETSGHRKHSSVWKEFVNLRLANPSLKVLLSVRDYGGPDRHIENKSYEKRQTFINNVVEFLRRWDFDGFGFIYYRTFTPAAGRFIEEMHAAFAAEATSSGRDSLILMVKLHPWRKDGFAEGVDVQGLAEAVDILQIHTMQYSLGYYDTTGLSTPLYGHNRNVARSIMGFLDDGMTPEKLYMTVQLYAISFTLSDPELNGVGAPAIDEGKTGEYSRRPFGELTYYEVCKLLQEGGYTTKVDPEGLVNFAYKGDQWMTYEDPASLEIKMSFVYEHNLGGVAAEYLYDDDYTGQFCNGGRYPLLSTLYNYRPAISEMP